MAPGPSAVFDGCEIEVPPRLQIIPTGNLGNQMLQVMLTETLQHRLPSLQVGGLTLVDWGLRRQLAEPLRSKPLRLIGQYVDLQLLARLLETGVLRELELAALGFRMSHYLPRAQYASLFPRRAGLESPVGSNTLLINVRGAETLENTHADYGPIPVSFYSQLVGSTGLTPVFMGQIGVDRYSDALRRAFPAALFLPSRGAMGDFELIRSAQHIVVSVSTFSWLAAWFSDAQSIHLPVVGMFNPHQRPDIDLLPLNDSRYHFYRFPVRHWTGSPDQFEALEAAASYPQLSNLDAQAGLTLATAQLTRRTSAYRRSLVIEALANRLLRLPGRVGLRVDAIKSTET